MFPSIAGELESSACVTGADGQGGGEEEEEEEEDLFKANAGEGGQGSNASHNGTNRVTPEGASGVTNARDRQREILSSGASRGGTGVRGSSGGSEGASRARERERDFVKSSSAVLVASGCAPTPWWRCGAVTKNDEP